MINIDNNRFADAGGAAPAGEWNPYYNSKTGESLRTLIVEYGEQADELSDCVIEQALHWHRFKAGWAEFQKTFPEIVPVSTYHTTREQSAFEERALSWLDANVGSGGYWQFSASANPRQVDIDPGQREWDWAWLDMCIGFKQSADALAFKFTFDKGR